MNSEWLETDGKGGYACGTVSGERSRRYHGLLIHASAPPSSRIVLVNGFEAWISVGSHRYALTTQRYHTDIVFPESSIRILEFKSEPWPTWIYQLENGFQLKHELAISRDSDATLLRWELLGNHAAQLTLRPLLSGRDHHSLHQENALFDFESKINSDKVSWKPYPNIAGIVAVSNGRYESDPIWYRNFIYTEERARGFDHAEDLASPGQFTWTLNENPAVLRLTVDEISESKPCEKNDLQSRVCQEFLREEHRRNQFVSPTHRAADAYVVERKRGKTIIAGYPWFGDWGRDTFIAVRGLCIATNQLETAAAILTTWAEELSEGMMPNCFPDDGREPVYNSVDASLWFVVAAYDFCIAARNTKWSNLRIESMGFATVMEQILTAYHDGTRFDIKVDDDGLLLHGNADSQLTWMDARVDGEPVTARSGKAVEIQALWLNALRIGSETSDQWKVILEKGVSSFERRFWNEEQKCLYDVIDVNSEHGRADTSIRPNQVFAVGGLPFSIINGRKAKQLLNTVEKNLLTPMGLRTLSMEDSAYCPEYRGDPDERDHAYHQGTVWPWLIGPFIEGWLRVRNYELVACTQARKRFLKPLELHLHEAGLGHISELGDGNSPHAPKGCPFQAWSLGEYLRISRILDDIESGIRENSMLSDSQILKESIKEARRV